MQHALPVSSFLIWSSKWNLVRSTSFAVHYYKVFLTTMFLTTLSHVAFSILKGLLVWEFLVWETWNSTQFKVWWICWVAIPTFIFLLSQELLYRQCCVCVCVCVCVWRCPIVIQNCLFQLNTCVCSSNVMIWIVQHWEFGCL